MLVFLDESYQVIEVGNVWTALSAVCLPRETSREIARELFNLKRRFWKVGEPDEIELKGSHLLGARGIQSPRNRDFVTEVLSLCKLYHLTPFAVAQQHAEALELSRLKAHGVLPDLHKAILRRVQRFMEDVHSDRIAVLSFDERNRAENRQISRAFRNYLFKSKEGRDLSRIMETPFFHDSAITPAAEIADIVAYVICARYAGRKADPVLEDFFSRFRDLTHNAPSGDWSTRRLWGFSGLGVEDR